MAQFYNATDKELSLYHMTLWFCGISLSDTTTFPVDPDFTMIANKNVRRVGLWLWKSSDEWLFDDANLSTLPVATTTLVASQEDYQLPVTCFSLKRVEVKDSAGDFKLLQPIRKDDITGAIDEFGETDGMPSCWYINGNSLIIKPAPAAASVTTASGIKIHVDLRDIDEFTPADTTQEPGFHAYFHSLVALLNAYDYCMANQKDGRLPLIKEQIAEYKFDLDKVSNFRNAAIPTRITPKMYKNI